MNGKGIHITSKILGGILAFLFLVAIASHDKRIQKKVADLIGAKLENVIEGKLSFSSLHLSPYGALVLKDLLVIDPNPYTADTYGKGYAPTDTLLYAESISASFSLRGLFNNEGLHLGRVRIENGGLFIVSEDPEERGRKTNFEILIKSQDKDTSFVAQPGPALFDISRVSVSNFRFRLINFKPKDDPEKASYGGVGINFEDMDVTTSLRAHGMAFAGGRLGATLDHLEAVEKSGYAVSDLSGYAISGLGKTEVSDLHLEDGVSTVNLRTMEFTFKNITYFQDFVNKVCIDASFGKSHVSISSVNYFSRGSLSGNELVFDVAGGSVHGTVNDLQCTDIQFSEVVSGVRGTATARVGDVVPNVSNLMLDARVTGCSFTSRQMSVFLTNWAVKSGKSVDLSKLAPKESLIADAFCNGNIDDLDIGATLGSASFGRLRFEGNVKEAYSKRSPMVVTGAFSADSLHVGRTIGNDQLGRTAAEGEMKLVMGNPMAFQLDSLNIGSINALGYTFQDMVVRAELADNTASCQLVSRDPSLSTSLFGLVDLKPFDGKRRLRLGATIDNADLHEMGLDKKGGATKFGATVYANMIQDSTKLLGDAFIDKIRVDYGDGFVSLGDISLKAFSREDNQNIRLLSPFLDLDLTSTSPLNELLEDIQDMTVRKYLPALASKPQQRDSCGNYNLDVTFHNSRDLMSYIQPKLYISDSTSLRLSLEDGRVRAEFNSPRLAFGSKFARNVSLRMSNDSTSLGTELRMDEINTGGIVIRDPSIKASAISDSARVNIFVKDVNELENVFDVCTDAVFARDEEGRLGITVRPHGSTFTTGPNHWTVSDNPITVKGKDFAFDNFSITSGVQSLYLDGGFSRDKADTLGLYLNQLNLSVIDNLLSQKIGIRGITTGQALITSPAATQLGLLINVGCDSLAVGKTEAGTVRITSHWNEADKKIYAILRNTLDGKDILTAEGNYMPEGGEFGASAEFSDFALAVAAPLLSTIFSEMDGYLSGGIQASGKGREDISIVSHDVRLTDARMTIGATGVSYTLNGPIRIDDSGIYLEKMDIRDDNDGRGTLAGTMHHSKLTSLDIDASASLRNLDVITIPEGKGLSGHLKANGDIKVKGPINALVVDANISTANQGDVHVPLSGALSSEKNDLLTFTEPARQIDLYEQMMKEQMQAEEKVKTDFRARGRLRLLPGVNAFMEINKASGNIITLAGDGDVNLELRPLKKQFMLDGMYMINKGNYHFVLPGVLEKDFSISNGSFVKFGGDINDTELDINAIYQTHTSLSTLLADTTVVATRRLVECGLNISGKLSNPSIGFSVNVPDLDPTTKSKVDGALNTEDKIQKQFVALLLFGSFLPSEQSGVFNQSNILYSNLGEIMSSQINSIFDKLDIPLDIGLGYQETTTGNNAFDVAVSTQLFNNRVVVNGSVGNRKYSSGSATTTSGDIVGDIDIEFKLDKEGKFRLNAFSHSADQYTSYLDNSQRNGIGASYQQEYNTFREFWHNLFKKRAKKAESETVIEEVEEAPGNKIITIENDSRKAISDTLDVRR